MANLKEALRDIDNLKNTLLSNKDKLTDSLLKRRADIRAEEIRVCDDIKTIFREGGKKVVFKHNDSKYEAGLAADAGIDSFLVSIYPKEHPDDILECKMAYVVGGENSSRDKFECAFDNLKDLRRVYDSLNEYEESVSVARDFVVAYTQFLQCELKSYSDLMDKLLAK